MKRNDDGNFVLKKRRTKNRERKKPIRKVKNTKRTIKRDKN